MSSAKAIPFKHIPWACLLAILAAMIPFGCQQDIVCEAATDASLRIGFYTFSENGQATTTSVDSLTIYGVGRSETKIYDNRKNVVRIELPVNPTVDSTAYVFIFPGHTDTLWVDYSRNPHLISVECGFTMFYEIENVQYTNHQIIRSDINTNLVSNTLDEHIQIFIPAPANGL